MEEYVAEKENDYDEYENQRQLVMEAITPSDPSTCIEGTTGVLYNKKA